MTVTVYEQPPGVPCNQCRMTKRELDKLGVPYGVEVLEGANLEAAKALGHLSAPVVVVERHGETESWAGFIPEKIKGLAGEARG